MMAAMETGVCYFDTMVQMGIPNVYKVLTLTGRKGLFWIQQDSKFQNFEIGCQHMNLCRKQFI
jgi:hypothetical protein